MTMANIQKTWAEVQYRLKNALGTAHGRGGTASEMLKYSDTNRRIVSVNQAQWGAFMDLEFQAFVANSDLPIDEAAKIWGWLPSLKQALEKYQLTLDDGQDARNEFLEVKMYEAKAQSNKGKNTLSIETSAGNNEGDNQ
jgi:hypothetical protein